MPVFIRDDIAVLYIHVPKTGGNYIQSLFSRNGFASHLIDISDITSGMNSLRTCSPQHYHASLLRKTLRLEKFDYVFMTVRNPVKRLKSEFLWNMRGLAFDPNVWAKHMFFVYESDSFILDNHIRPQAQFWLEGADVFKIEDGYREASMKRLTEKIGIDLVFPEELQNDALSYAGHTVDDVQFDNTTLSNILEFYSDDFDKFGYESGP